MEPGVLHAYDAATLRRLWSAPDPHMLAKFVPPTIADQLVFLATFSNKVLVYGRRDAWRGPVSFDPADMRPGAHITDLVRQTDAILARLAVDRNGPANVIWLDQELEPQRWQVASFGPPDFPPGTPATNLVRQTDAILAALAVGDDGRERHLARPSRCPQHWQVAPFGPSDLPPGAPLTNLVRQTDTILAALTIARTAGRA